MPAWRHLPDDRLLTRLRDALGPIKWQLVSRTLPDAYRIPPVFAGPDAAVIQVEPPSGDDGERKVLVETRHGFVRLDAWQVIAVAVICGWEVTPTDKWFSTAKLWEADYTEEQRRRTR